MVSSQSSTQFGGNQQDICYVVVGFDFGTSSSKVVIRTPFHNSSKATPVAFPTANGGTSYFLPTTIWIDDASGKMTFNKPSTESRLVLNIKHNLVCNTGMQGDSPLHSQKIAVGYIAMVLRYAREWFLKQHASIYSSFKLQWSLNIGLPSEDYSNEDLTSSFQRVANAAWEMSIISDAADFNFDNCEKCLSSQDHQSLLGSDDTAEVEVIPEIAAAVAGYARSNQRNEGLHLLVDIGAGTFDVCGFVLHERDGDDCYEILTADVRDLGTNIFAGSRLAWVEQTVLQRLQSQSQEFDPMIHSPDCHALGNIDLDCVLNAHGKWFMKKCKQQIFKTIVALKTKRDPNSKAFKGALPIFISGGGALSDFFRQAILDYVAKEYEEYYTPSVLRPVSVPMPITLEKDLSKDLFHRLAVAWGLSYPSIEIGNVYRPGDISDISPKEVMDTTAGFISKDMV
jgi:hypothetical protein